MVEAGELEYSGVLKTRKLLILRDAKTQKTPNCGQLERIWNVDLQLAGQFCDENLGSRTSLEQRELLPKS
jgi:hypothetical protein